MNAPITALTDRTQYLFEHIAALSSNAKLTAPAQPVGDNAVAQYSVVYYDGESTSTPGLKLASPKIAALAIHPFFRGANEAHVFGVVSSVPASGTADVCMQGLLADTGIVTSMLDSVYTDFVSGPLYLSGLQNGKLSPYPNGLAIFVAYAKSLDEIYLNPNQESLSELFWSFRYNLLDRPAGLATFASGTWGLTSVSTTKVGWIPASTKITSSGTLYAMFPDGVPKYYYQLPDIATIESNNPELTAAEKLAAKNLRAALPARPNTFSFLSVNGVVYSPRVAAEDKGSYVLNDLGLWWFSDTYDSAFDNGEFDQPWASDLATSLPADTSLTYQSDHTAIFLKDAQGQAITGLSSTPGFAALHPIQFFAGSGGVLPSPLVANTAYVIKTVGTDSFTVALAASPGTVITLASAGTGPWYLRWDPDFWRIGKGAPASRVNMNLQFTKLNPDVRQNLVTSLQASPDVATPAIRVLSLPTGEKATTGDLKLKLELPVVASGATALGGSAIKGLAYDSTTERLSMTLGSVVSEIRNGGGLKIDADPVSGIYTVAFANAYANAITELEPEQSRLEYYGLNSYLAMAYDTTPTGVIGKFTLPDQLAGTGGSYLNLIMTLLGKTTSGSTTKKVRFKFEYSVAKLGSPLSANVTTISSTEITMPTITNGVYQAYYPFEVLGDGAVSPFRIPVSELAGKATVNFRISRLVTDPTNTLYTGVVGMSGIYWLLL